MVLGLDVLLTHIPQNIYYKTDSHLFNCLSNKNAVKNLPVVLISINIFK